MLGIQKILRKDWTYIIKERVQNLQEEVFGEYYIVKNILQKVRQFLENII